MLLASTAAHAQTGLSASFTGTQLKNTDWFYGPTLGLYHDQYHLAPLHLGYDLRGAALYSGERSSIVEGLAGLRLSVVPHVLPVKVYGEGLLGVARVELPNAAQTRFEYRGALGVEYTVLPRVDWRIVEPTWTGYSGNDALGRPFGISTGLVVRLP